MNDSNSPIDSAGQVAALQRQVFTLMLALLVVSGTVAAFLGYESYHLGKDVEAINAQVILPYKQKLPAIEDFISKIVAYGQTHPDFNAILVKDGVVQVGTNAAAKPAAAAPSAAKPAVAAPAAPKK
jgi:hypothetical protein